jgi:4-amino-4-deoxy-L-arabinose transferase-like glycosyltransferase
VTNNLGSFTSNFFGPKRLSALSRRLPWLFFAGVAVALFCQLGAAALFEPDEGRNAEKAREILILNDWVTPHENFHAVLDKPIFFYWLIAVAYKFFGVSEWAARLPSALAALGSIALVYRFADVHWGRWTALWSALILLTNVEFFVFCRIVIFDMTLTFFLTLALCAFYEAIHADDVKRRRLWWLAMYVALGCATLIKGLIGVVIPGMVIFVYLLLSKQWAALKRIDLIPGALLFFAIVLPWYIVAEQRNAGYLRYYLWEEHFGRFTTNEFDRREPWYYFIGVGFVGFLPWTLLLPLAAKAAWRSAWTEKFDDKTLFLILWIVLPFLFFSVSKSKLPHYILPIFPALTMLTAVALVRLYQDTPAKLQFALSRTWWILLLLSFFLLSGRFFPVILPRQIRVAVDAMNYFLWIFAAVSIVMLAYMANRSAAERPRSQRRLFVLQGLGLCFFLALIVKIMILISPERSARPIAAATLPRLSAAMQVVFYDTYVAGMSFYLQSERPLWFITHAHKKRTLLGNYYAIGKRADPTTSWGKAILTFQEFQEYWKTTRQPLLIIVKEKNLARLASEVGEAPVKLAAVDEYLLVSKP